MSGRKADPMLRIGPMLQVAYAFALVTRRRIAPVLGISVRHAYRVLGDAEAMGLLIVMRAARVGRPSGQPSKRELEPDRQTVYALSERGVEVLVAWEARATAERSAA